MTRTERQIRKSGIDTTGMEFSTNEVEIYVTNKNGEFSDNKTRKAMRQVSKVLGWGGYRCGYGAWILSKDYQDMGDWNDKSSRWHY